MSRHYSHILGILVLLGAASVADAQTRSFDIAGVNQNDNYGAALTCAGHMIAVGAPGIQVTSIANVGAIDIWDAQTNVLIANILYPLGANGGERFGFSMSFMPDLNADGAEDLIVGSPSLSSTSASRAFVYTSNFASAPTSVLVPTTNAEQFGYAVAPIGDLNSDGKSEVLVSAPQRIVPFTGAGGVDIFDVGSNPSSPALLRSYSGTAPFEQLGMDVAEVGDFDFDTKHDFLAAAPLASTAGGTTGLVKLFSSSPAQTLIATINGTQSGEHFGESIASVGDVNGDGIDDFLIGAPRSAVNGTDSGRIELINGGSLLSSGTGPQTLCSIAGISPGDLFGTKVYGLGDINGDGVRDFAVTAPGAGGSTGNLQVYSYIGGSCIIQTTVVPTVSTGPFLSQQFGVALAGSGRLPVGHCDINGDGVADFAVGAKGAAGVQDGHAFFYQGVALATPTPAAPPTPAASPTSQLFFKVDENGRFTGGVLYKNLPTTSSPGCNASLYGRWAIGNTFGPVTKIVSADIVSDNVSYTAGTLPRVEKAVHTIPVVNMIVRTVCGSVQFDSNIFARYMNCGNNSPPVLPQEWMSLLRDSFTAAGNGVISSKGKQKLVGKVKFRKKLVRRKSK